MSFKEDNLRLVKKYHSYLIPFMDHPASAELEIFESNSGVVSAKIGGLFIHSRFDPMREAENLISKEVSKDITAALFYGFGLGFYAEVFCRLFPGIPVVIFEPDISSFIKAMESRPLDFVLSSRNVMIFPGKEVKDVSSILHNIPTNKLQIIKLRSVFNKEIDFYKSLDKGINDFLSKKEINLNTLNRFGRLWIKNLSRNIRRLVESPGVVSLQNHFNGIPAIVIASGPSLDEIMDRIVDLQKRFLIICVDTSLRACRQAGIDPDFIIVVDPQYWNTRHFDWTTSEKAFLISESSTHPRIFRFFSLKSFFASSFFPLGEYFESFAGYKGKMGAGGSVATSAWDFARLAGCNPIYIAGLDLGFPGKLTHFKGAFFEEGFHTVSDRLTPIDLLNVRYLKGGIPFYAVSNSNKSLLTDRRMEIYRLWFESQMNLYPQIATFNLSRDGLKIKDMPLTGIEALLEYPVIREEIDSRNKSIMILFDNIHPEPVIEQTKSSIRLMLEDITSLINLSRQGMELSRRLKHLYNQKRSIRDALNDLNAVDRKILNQSSRIIAGFLLQGFISNMKNSSSQTEEETIQNSEALYTELYESARYHFEELSNGLEYLG